MIQRRARVVIFIFLINLLLCPLQVCATGSFSLSASCLKGQQVKICVLVTEKSVVVDGYDIYRMNKDTNNFDLVGTIDISKYGYNKYTDENNSGNISKLFYTIEETHALGETYDFQVKSFQYEKKSQTGNSFNSYKKKNTQQGTNINKNYLETEEINVTIQGDAPEIIHGKRNGKLDVELKWEKDNNASGYVVYYVKNYTNKSKKKCVDIRKDSAYKVLTTITNADTTSVNFENLMNGVTYTYRICSYIDINGQQVYSLMSEPISIIMDYYSYNGESYQQKVKRAFGTEKKKVKKYANQSKAAKQMKTISIKVWDFENGVKGKKVTKVKYITVNKRLAPSIKAMFDEIYKCKDKQVIKEIGCYSYRTGEHMYGLAIDINPNENYMIDNGTVLAGSFWNPKKSKYSIPLKCETVRIMERYGFYRGFWGNRKDYMHFSYFGT